uniref:Uncharacterized protein n=1 Tax=Rhizophora mucronata TaxID=61149 RepID=A0A2P2NEQ2_RHIMU
MKVPQTPSHACHLTRKIHQRELTKSLPKNKPQVHASY